MARYIDADKFMETIKINTYGRYRMSKKEIEQWISEQPAFDPYLDRKAVVRLIEQALKDSWKDYDPRLESFAEGLIEKIKKMDGPLDQSLRAAEPALKPEDIDSALDDYIEHLIDDMMKKWREHGGKHLKIVLTYGGKEIGQIEIS